MYSKDFRIRHLLAIFFAIGISHEILVLLNIINPILSLVYTVGLLIVIFNYTNLEKYLWPPGLGLIGIFSLLYFIFLAIGYKEGFFRDLSSAISILVWIRCIKYLNEDDENNEIIDQNEDIREM